MKMRTTVTLDQDVYEAVKAMALAAGKPLGAVLSELARRALKARALSTRRRGGLPVFRVSPGARAIPSRRASDLDERA